MKQSDSGHPDESKILSAFLRQSARDSGKEESISVSAGGGADGRVVLSAASSLPDQNAEIATDALQNAVLPQGASIESVMPTEMAEGRVVKPFEERSVEEHSALKPIEEPNMTGKSAPVEAFRHLSPAGAEMMKRLTDPAEKAPFRSFTRVLDDSPEEFEEPDDFEGAEEFEKQEELEESGVPKELSREEEMIEPSVEMRPESSEKTYSESVGRFKSDNGPIPSPELSAEPKKPTRWENPERDAFFADDYFPSDLAAEPSDERPRSKAGPLMAVADLHKGYVKGKLMIPVLRGVDIEVKSGELLSIVGQSGSGKSTLLHLMGTLDTPDRGTIHFDGQRIDNLPGSRRDLLRNRSIGMIFQFYHLIPEMTMIENVLAPLMIRESTLGYFRNRRRYHRMAKELLERVGLGHRVQHKPNELSGGEMQRTAIARALITEPRILLADEPTGNLDSRTSREIIKLLRTLNEEQKLTIVMVTHDQSQAEEADRYIRLVDGQVVRETEN